MKTKVKCNCCGKEFETIFDPDVDNYFCCFDCWVAYDYNLSLATQGSDSVRV